MDTKEKLSENQPDYLFFGRNAESVTCIFL